MITISLQPFALKKAFALLCTVLGLSTASSFATSIFLPVESTPYDRQMTRVRATFRATGNPVATHELSLGLVNRWMEDLRDIPYGYQLEWRTPAEVESRRPADCKGKAVALYEKMHASGAKNVRLVIGKRAPTSRSTHTWLVWETSAGTYLLDPTFNWMACRAEKCAGRSYVPYYAYAGTKKYRAASSTLYANN